MLLRLDGIEKRFGGVRALAGAALAVKAGSVHGLLGENGAGKSTLIRLLSGLIRPDAGQILFDDSPVTIASVAEAEQRGLRFIHQELSLVPQFDAVENAFVGRPYPRKGPFIDRRAMRALMSPTAAEIAPDLPLDMAVGRMTTGQKQLIAILRALMPAPGRAPARLVVMDEPTASLSDGEAARLHLAIRALSARGVAVLFISHRLDEVMALCDRYTVLRGGTTAGSGAVADIDRAGLVRLMSGRDEVRRTAPLPVPTAPVVLSATDLAFGGQTLSLEVRAGEILGLYGLIGAGRSSLLKQLWGARRHRGEIVLSGQKMRPGSIADRIAAGCAYVPEDRRHEGLIAHRAIAENLALTDLPSVRQMPCLPVTSARRMVQKADAVRQALSVRMGSVWDLPLTLSGGNQQKLVFGRWLGRDLRLVLLDEPTRGVDIGAKAELHAEVRRLADKGAAVIMATSDMDELLQLASRVIVMAAGHITAGFEGDALTQERIVDAAFDHTERTPQ